MRDSQQSSPELDALVLTTEILTGELPFLEKCDSVLAVLGDFTDSEFVTLREFDPDNSTLNLVAYYNRSPLPESAHIPLPMIDTSLSAKALDNKIPIVVEDYTGLESPHRGYLDAGIRSAISIPVQVDGKTVGTLGFASRLVNHYWAETVRVLVGIAAVVGMIMAKAELQDCNEVEANVGRIVSSPLIGADVFERFAAEAARIIDFERLFLNSVNIPEKTFVTEFLIGDDVPDVDIGKIEQIGGTAQEIVLRSRKSQYFLLDEREGAKPRFPNAGPFIAAGLPYLICVPLIVGDQVIGTMGFIRSSRPYSRKDLAKTDRLGNLVAGAFADYKSEAYRKAAEYEIRESEERFRQMAENMRGAFWLFDIVEKRMLYVSPQAEDVWGYSVEQFYDDYFGWIAFVHEDDRKWVISEIEKQRVTGELDIEFRVVRDDGSIRWVSARGFPIRDEEGRLYRMAGIGEDITVQKSTAERIMQASHLASIGELSAGVAHEINNPLAAIVLASDFLSKSDLPDEAAADVKIISESAQRAARIVQNMLLFARKKDPTPERMTIDLVVEQALELKTHDFRLNKIESRLEVETDLPNCLIDRHQMGQVIINVLNNSEHILATHQGGGNITIDIRSTFDSVILEVRDDGPGIEPELIPKIFEPFFTTKSAGEGTGLGLSICYGIIRQHGGEMWAANNEGGGTSIFIQLPIAHLPVAQLPVTKLPVAEIDLTSPPAELQPEEATDVSMTRLLVVDDELAIRELIAKGLRREIDIIHQAQGGEAALEMIRETDYDCILLDLMMPGISGAEVYDRIVATNPNLTDRIIFMTGDTARRESAAFLSDRKNLVIGKPFQLKNIRRTVASVVSASQHHYATHTETQNRKSRQA